MVLSFLHFLTQIPLVIWLLVALMLGWTATRIKGMTRQSRELCRAMEELVDLVGEGDSPRGLSPEALEAMGARARGASPVVQAWWRRLERHLEAYPTTGPTRRHVLDRPVREILPESELFEALYKGSQYQALPGIITSLGLAGTFLAILLGLFHVTYDPSDPTQPVRGIDQLINNLSGKFASSLIALALAITFIVLEKRCERRNRLAYDRLMACLEEALPLLTPVRVMVDLQGTALRQEATLQALAPELEMRLSRSLAVSLQPPLERMGSRLEALSSALGRLETGRQDALLQELGGLIRGLQSGLQTGLQDMGRDFHQALTGSAQLELTGLQQSMEGTRVLLEGLGHHISQLQGGFSGAMEAQLASLTATMETLGLRLEQMGSRMIERMGEAQSAAQARARDSVAQLEEQAGRASSRILEDLESGQRRGEAAMGELLARLEEARLQTLQAGGTALAQMRTLAAQTSQELSSLLQAVGSGARDFTQASERLSGTQRSLDSSLESHLRGLRTLQAAEGQLGSLLERTGATAERQAEQSAGLHQLLERLATLQQGGGTLLQDYAAAFEGTRAHLGSLDSDLARAFAVIHGGMETWTASVERALQTLTRDTDTHYATLSRTFSTQIEDLGERLVELTEALDRILAGESRFSEARP
nr:hypothetical protein [uncultured Holophaga sp.]